MNNTYTNEGYVVRYNLAGAVQWTSRFVGGVLSGKVASSIGGTGVYASFQQNFANNGSSSPTDIIYNGTSASNTETLWGGQNATSSNYKTVVRYDKLTGGSSMG